MSYNNDTEPKSDYYIDFQNLYYYHDEDTDTTNFDWEEIAEELADKINNSTDRKVIITITEVED